MQIDGLIHIFLIYYLFQPFFSLFNHQINFTFADEIMGEPKIAYMDGNQPWDDCRPGLKRSLNALTGLLISHHQYGSSPYNSSRNCFLTIAVPIGYRVRLKALDFDVQGRWRQCEDQDTLHVFDHDRPLEPKMLAVEETLPIRGHSPGKILGEFCGKMPPKDPKENRHKHFVLAESSQNALTLWWHSEPQKEEEGRQNNQQMTILPPASRPFAQGYRLLWSSFRHVDGRQCRPKSNQSGGFGEFQCGGRGPKPTTATHPPNGPTHSFVECIPSPLGCNSNADCADGTDLDVRQKLWHGCQNIPNDPLSLLTSSGPKRLLLVGALVLLWLSICLGCSCCLVHHRRRRQKNKQGIRSQHFVGGKMHQNGRPNGFKNIAANDNTVMETDQVEERGQMILANNPVSHHPFSFISSSSEFPPLPAPPLPPPSFSPPAIPKNGPPAAPAININKSNNCQQRPQQIGQQFNGIDQNQQRQNQITKEKRRQRQPAGHAPKQHSNSQQSASSSSSSNQHPIMPFGYGDDPPSLPKQLNGNSGVDAVPLPTINDGEYFYVHKTATDHNHPIQGQFGGREKQRPQNQQKHLLL